MTFPSSQWAEGKPLSEARSASILAWCCSLLGMRMQAVLPSAKMLSGGKTKIFKGCFIFKHSLSDSGIQQSSVQEHGRSNSPYFRHPSAWTELKQMCQRNLFPKEGLRSCHDWRLPLPSYGSLLLGSQSEMCIKNKINKSPCIPAFPKTNKQSVALSNSLSAWVIEMGIFEDHFSWVFLSARLLAATGDAIIQAPV